MVGHCGREAGRAIDFESHGRELGGEWVTEAMASGSEGMGMMGTGVNHTGPGWRHANGMYGLAFTFTTGRG